VSDFDLPPLDDDLRALLHGARGTVRAPFEARQRLSAWVNATALGGRGGPTEGRGVNAGKAAAPTAFARWAPLAIGFLAGGVVGGLVVKATVHDPPPKILETPPRIVYVERSAVSGAPSPSAPSPSASSAPSVSFSRGPSGVERPADRGTIAAERTLLDRARASLEQGDGTAALRLTREHERRFASGMLAQEREAIAIRALLLLDQTREARVRLDQFRARYPGSVLLPMLEAQMAVPPSSP
jgi:hypothetical protein